MARNNNFTKSLIIAFSTIALGIVACTKDTGFYDAALDDKTFSGSTYEYLKSKPGVYDSLLRVIGRVGLKGTLTDSNVTLFAVTNPSFQLALTNLNNLRNQTDKLPLYLYNVDSAHLDTMVSQYLIRGSVTSDQLTLQDGLRLQTMRYDYPMHGRLSKGSSSGYVGGGAELIEFSNTNKSQFVRDWITTNTSSNNVKTKNGVVHIVSGDHVFGFNQFVSRLTYVPPPPRCFFIGGTLTGSRDNPQASEGASRAVDRDPFTKFLGSDFINGWLKFELPAPAVAGSYTIMSANDFPERDPAGWTIEGSNDNQTWTFLDSRTGEVFKERYMERVFFFTNKQAFKYYRITINAIRSGNATQFAE